MEPTGPENPYASPHSDAVRATGSRIPTSRVIGALLLIVPGALLIGAPVAALIAIVGEFRWGHPRWLVLMPMFGWGAAWVIAGVAFWRGKYFAAAALVGLGVACELTMCGGLRD